MPVPWASVYGNWTTSFGLNKATTRGRPLTPETAEQVEVGAKMESFNKS